MISEELRPRDVQFINAKELNDILSSKPEDIILLDVREKNELTDQLGHLKGIIHIPIGALRERAGELEQYRPKTIVVICRTGTRSKTGAQILINSGFENVFVLKGGMVAWRNENYPVE